jgi:hypothetical protein
MMQSSSARCSHDEAHLKQETLSGRPDRRKGQERLARGMPHPSFDEADSADDRDDRQEGDQKFSKT